MIGYVVTEIEAPDELYDGIMRAMADVQVAVLRAVPTSENVIMSQAMLFPDAKRYGELSSWQEALLNEGL